MPQLVPKSKATDVDDKKTGTGDKGSSQQLPIENQNTSSIVPLLKQSGGEMLH